MARPDRAPLARGAVAPRTLAAASGPLAAGPGPLAAALVRIGDRWSLRIVEALLRGPLRFGDLQRSVDGIAPNILSDRLKRLEGDALLVATAYVERPPRFEYRLTTDGRALAGALRLLADWGAAHAGGTGGTGDHEALRHDACGTTLEVRWYCPTCGLNVEADPGPGTRRV